MDEAERGQSGRGGGYIGWRTCEGVISTGKARRVRQGRQSGPSLVSRLPRVTCAVLSSPRPQSRAALVLKFCSHSTLWREPWTRDRVHSSQYEWESHKRSTELSSPSAQLRPSRYRFQHRSQPQSAPSQTQSRCVHFVRDQIALPRPSDSQHVQGIARHDGGAVSHALCKNGILALSHMCTEECLALTRR